MSVAMYVAVHDANCAWRVDTRPQMSRFLLIAALLAFPASAQARVRVEPRAAVPGAAIAVKGAALKGGSVTIGGKRARVLRARTRELRVVVPRVKPGMRRLVVRRGQRRTVGRLRVLPAFTGAVKLKVDRKRAARAGIGPAGGTVAARGRDGTRYRLTVPAGALSGRTAITITPVRAFAGLPLTGGSALGVRLQPDGLRFAKPATLAITAARRPPRKMLAFNDPAGPGFEVGSVARSGRTLRLAVPHFSGAGAGGANPADFAAVVGPLIAGVGDMTQGQVEILIALIGDWQALFGPDFCSTQPVCGQAVDKALDSLRVLVEERCASARLTPSVGAVRDVTGYEALRQHLGANDNITTDCQHDILAAMIADARAALASDPLGRFEFTEDLTATGGAGGDVDHDGTADELGARAVPRRRGRGRRVRRPGG